MQNIDLNSGDWKETNKPMYYSQQKRSWYCKECNFLTQSPRTAGAHAEEHELPLPFSRNKIEVELVPAVQPQLQPQTPKAEPNYRSYSENRNYSYSQNNRECNDITSPNYVPTTPLDAKIWKRLQGRKIVNAMRMTGVFTDKEIEERERELGLNPKEDPAKKAEEDKKPILDLLRIEYSFEEDPDRQMNLMVTMSIIENEKDSQNIPFILATMLKKPQPKRDTLFETFCKKFLECVEKKEKESSKQNLDETVTAPSQVKNSDESVTPPNPTNNELDLNFKP